MRNCKKRTHNLSKHVLARGLPHPVLVIVPCWGTPYRKGPGTSGTHGIEMGNPPPPLLPGRDIGPLEKWLPPGRDMGPVEVLWDGDGVHLFLHRTWDQWLEVLCDGDGVNPTHSLSLSPPPPPPPPPPSPWTDRHSKV